MSGTRTSPTRNRHCVQSLDMPAESIRDLAEQTFREFLTAAIANGRRPSHTTALGAASWIAIDLLAREHPDASPEHVVMAYDAFAFEHRGAGQLQARRLADPATARAAERAAIDDLLAHLRITYPGVAPTVMNDLVRRIHADFDDHRIRDFVPMIVEHAVLQKFA